MPKAGGRDRVIRPIVIIATIVLILCLGTCIYHIFDIQNNLEDEISRQVQAHLDVSNLVLSDKMEQSLSLLNEVAKQLEDKSREDFEKYEIFAILQKYQKVEDFLQIVYVDDSKQIFLHDGTQRDDKLEISKNFKSLTTDNVELINYTKDNQEVEKLLLYEVPVKYNEKTVGMIIGTKRCEGMLSAASFSYLNKIGDTFIVDNEGNLIDSKMTQCEEHKESHTNIEQCLIYNAKDSNKQIDKFMKQLNVTEFKSGTFEISNKNGNKNYIAYSSIQNLPTLHMVNWYSKDAYDIVMRPILVRSVISCTFIMVIMIITVFVVFYYNKKTMRVIKRLAYEDDITGGKNLNYFREYAVKTLFENSGMAFLAHRFDIVNFRYINEAYGHNRADKLLSIIVEEAYKIFHHNELCVRMNADQFILLTRNTNDLDERFNLFTESVNFRALDIGIRYPIKFKRGIYQIRGEEIDVAYIIDKANVARKSLNGEEKVAVAVYTDRIVNEMRKVDKIESEMEAALFNREFKVYLQAKWDIKNNKLYGGEALVRWVKQDGTIVYPNDFISIFEKDGFVEQLDFYMLEEVCKIIRAIIDAGGEPFPISVNQSRLLLHNPTYIKRVTEILEFYKIPKQYIELEITETVFFLEREKMVSIMNQLKSKQVLLSMDDFGSGYSSLNMLKDFPFDILKIDKEFFSESITSESSTWILKKIIEMAKGLNIKVLCEGVETAEQIEILKGIECQFVQGYYYSKPIPVNKFIIKNCGQEVYDEFSKRFGENLREY